jgi:hypothetical protein
MDQWNQRALSFRPPRAYFCWPKRATVGRRYFPTGFLMKTVALPTDCLILNVVAFSTDDLLVYVRFIDQLFDRSIPDRHK